jgi:hypothetical protein
LTGAASANVLKAGDTMTGVLAVTAGTAALPAITPSGDPNTGIFSPGADQLAISTNGTGRLFVNASGNVGVNTTAPQAYAGYKTLEVKDTTGGVFRLTDTGAAVLETIVNASEAYIKNVHAAPLWIGTSNTERLRLDSSGGLQFKGAGTAGVTQAVSFNGSAPVNSLVINSSGRVGLGTSSPGGQLTVFGAGQATTAFNTTTDLGGAIFVRDSNNLADNGGAVVFGASQGLFAGIKGLIKNGNSNTSGDLAFLTRTAPTDTTLSSKLYITAAGNVGIGTTTVSSPLHVKANSTEGIRIESPDFTGIYGLLTSRRSSGAPLDIAAIHSVGSLAPEISFSRSTNGSTFTESARIDSSGRLLVGTSTARTFAFSIVPRIQLEETTVSNGISITTNRNDGSGNILHFGKSRSVALGGSGIVNSGDSLGAIRFQGADGSALVSSAEIAAAVDGTPGANDMPGRLVFSTTADGASSPTERARITNAGAIAIGTTSLPSGTNAIWLDPASGERRFSRSATTAVFQIAFHNPNGLVGHIETSGSSTSYVTSSDYRLKENVVLLTGAIDRLQQIPVHRFNFIADPNTVVDGFLAHEAQAVVPECVTGAKDEVDEDGNPVYQGIDQSKLVPLLTAALQEALQKIEDLEGRLTAAGL